MPKIRLFLVLSEAKQLALLSELEFLLTITGIWQSLFPKKCGSHWSRIQILQFSLLDPCGLVPGQLVLSANFSHILHGSLGRIDRSIERRGLKLWQTLFFTLVFSGFHKPIHDFKNACPKVQASCHATVPVPPAIDQCPEIYTFAEFWFLPCRVSAHFSFFPISGSYLRFLDGVCLQICCEE